MDHTGLFYGVWWFPVEDLPRWKYGPPYHSDDTGTHPWDLYDFLCEAKPDLSLPDKWWIKTRWEKLDEGWLEDRRLRTVLG